MSSTQNSTGLSLTNHATYSSPNTSSLRSSFKKNDERNESITQHRTNDEIMCPVISCARTIKHILSYPIKDEDFLKTTVNTVFHNGTKLLLTGENFIRRIRFIVALLGKERLGFGPDEVGNHSPRSSCAMAMFLASTPVYSIMLQGRWKSDAFMRYIRKEVLQSSTGISTRMLTFETFYTIPSFVHTAADGNLNFSQRNNLSSSTNTLNGPRDALRRGQLPAFHLEH